MEVDTTFEGVTSIGAKYTPDVLTTVNKTPASTTVLPNSSLEVESINEYLFYSSSNLPSEISEDIFSLIMNI